MAQVSQVGRGVLLVQVAWVWGFPGQGRKTGP